MQCRVGQQLRWSHSREQCRPRQRHDQRRRPAPPHPAAVEGEQGAVASGGPRQGGQVPVVRIFHERNHQVLCVSEGRQ